MRGRDTSAAQTPLRGRLKCPSDKSISHRAVLFSAMAEGVSHLSGVLPSLDVKSSIDAVTALGAKVNLVEKNGALSGWIHGWGKAGPQPASPQLAGALAPLDCGNSGTTTRLLMGILAAWPLSVRLTGDESLCKRPMGRVIEPLVRMGASFASANGGGQTAAASGDTWQHGASFASASGGGQTLPLLVLGSSRLQAIDYCSPVASAQLKSAIILAGLSANGRTSVSEPALSRNHTELMLPAYGVKLDVSGLTVSVAGGQTLMPTDLDVPGDPSSAAFMLVAAALVAGSEVTVEGMLLNPTRTGFLRVMQKMGADVRIFENSTSGIGDESVGSVCVRYTEDLMAVEVFAEEVPSLIDELPILALLATAATGTTIFHGVEELKVKESDRLQLIIDGLCSLGFRAWAKEDDLVVEGRSRTLAKTAEAESFSAEKTKFLAREGSGWEPRQVPREGSGWEPRQVPSGEAKRQADREPREGSGWEPSWKPDACGDHRLAMTWAVAAIAYHLDLRLTAKDRAAVAVSYPRFFDDLQALRATELLL